MKMDKLARRFLIGATTFDGITGLICGALYLAVPSGKLMGGADELLTALRNFPFSDFFFNDFMWVGIAMILVLGIPSAVASIALLRKVRHQYRWALVANILLIVWCVYEMVFMPNPLCVVFLIAGIALVVAAGYKERIDSK